jgi:hypothetical protein
VVVGVTECVENNKYEPEKLFHLPIVWYQNSRRYFGYGKNNDFWVSSFVFNVLKLNVVCIPVHHRYNRDILHCTCMRWFYV